VSCPARVRRALQDLPGVKDVRVDYDRKEATVVIERDASTTGDLVQALGKAGFPGSGEVTP
jgi:mercuric ion binding protein